MHRANLDVEYFLPTKDMFPICYIYLFFHYLRYKLHLISAASDMVWGAWTLHYSYTRYHKLMWAIIFWQLYPSLLSTPFPLPLSPLSQSLDQLRYSSTLFTSPIAHHHDSPLVPSQHKSPFTLPITCFASWRRRTTPIGLGVPTSDLIPISLSHPHLLVWTRSFPSKHVL